MRCYNEGVGKGQNRPREETEMTYVEYTLAVASFAMATIVGQRVREATQVATAKVIARVFR